MRLDPREATVKRLYALSGNECAFPGCGLPVVDERTGVVVGQICHIAAANPEGPRYDPDMTDEERRAFENLVVMCSMHNKFVDTVPAEFPAERLREIKRIHEARHSGQADRLAMTGNLDEVVRQLMEHLRTASVISPVDARCQAEAEATLRSMPVDQVPQPGDLPSRSSIPIPPNSLFTGRDRELKRLARSFRSPTDRRAPVVGVVGWGGVGKSQLANEFSHRYGRFFEGGVLWLNFEDPDSVPSQIAVAGERMGIRPDFASLGVDSRVNLVQRELANPLPRLLVFDNCEEPSLLERWRPVSGGARVLLTSRKPDWAPELGMEILELGDLPRAESVSLLRELTGRPDADPQLLDAVANALGDLPLALQVAGAYLRKYRHDLSLDGYLVEIRRPDLLGHRSLTESGVSLTGHTAHVARTFAVSYEKLNPDDPADELARRLLARAAYFSGGDIIPRAALFETAGLLQNQSTRLEGADALARLADLGLVKIQPDGAIWLHPLIAAFAWSSDESSDGLTGVLRSEVPAVVLEAVYRASSLAQHAPQVVGPVARDVSSSTQPWSRTAALWLALQCGDEYVDADALKEQLSRISSDEGPFAMAAGLGYEVPWFSNERGLLQEFTLRAVGWLIHHSDRETIQPLLEQVALHAQLSSANSQKLSSMLAAHGFDEVNQRKQDVLKHQYPLLYDQRVADWFHPERDRELDEAILRAVLAAAERMGAAVGTPIDESGGCDLRQVSTLIGSMDWSGAEVAPTDRVYVFRDHWKESVVETVLRGVIVALDLSPETLHAEASWAVSHISEPPWTGDDGLGSLISLPSATAEPDWARAAAIGLSANELAAGLGHPVEPIADAAAALLAHGAGGLDAKEAVREVLSRDNPRALFYVSRIAKDVWGDEAGNLLIHRLQSGLTPGTQWLIESLPDVVDVYASSRCLDLLQAALFVNDVDIAEQAVNVLAADPGRIPPGRVEGIREALDFWTENGWWCRRHRIRVFQDFCPECHSHEALPRPRIVALLDELGALSVADLEQLSVDASYEVASRARESMAQACGQDVSLLLGTIRKVRDGELPVGILAALLALAVPGLGEARELLLALLQSESVDVRRTLMHGIESGGWLPDDVAREAAERGLRDPDLSVRNQSLKTLRSISRRIDVNGGGA